MTVGLLAVVVYLYTVVAFNFFRKFYNKSEDEDEPDMKCDDMMTVSYLDRLAQFMKRDLEDVYFTLGCYGDLLLAYSSLQCYLFHMYVGVRAGGGIGDEIEDPAGDEYELYRVVFDITFFFFVIVILLAIIQGMNSPVYSLFFGYVIIFSNKKKCFVGKSNRHVCKNGCKYKSELKKLLII